MARILVIEDDPSTRTLLGAVLQTDGHQATLVPNSADAVRTIQDTSRFDLFVVDLHGPGQNGFTFLEWARQQPLTCPVLVVSGADEMRDGILAGGAQAFVVKPFAIQKLRQAVRETLPNATH